MPGTAELPRPQAPFRWVASSAHVLHDVEDLLCVGGRGDALVDGNCGCHSWVLGRPGIGRGCHGAGGASSPAPASPAVHLARRVRCAERRVGRWCLRLGPHWVGRVGQAPGHGRVGAGSIGGAALAVWLLMVPNRCQWGGWRVATTCTQHQWGAAA